MRIIKNIFIPFQSISLLSNKPKCTSFILLSKWNCGGAFLFSKCRIFFYDFFRIPGTMIYNDKKTCAYLSLHSVNILVIDGMLWRYIQKKNVYYSPSQRKKSRKKNKDTCFDYFQTFSFDFYEFAPFFFKTIYLLCLLSTSFIYQVYSSSQNQGTKCLHWFCHNFTFIGKFLDNVKRTTPNQNISLYRKKMFNIVVIEHI